MVHSSDDAKRGEGRWNVIFSTDDFPEADRVRAFNETFGAFGGVRYVKSGSGPFKVTAKIQTVGDLVAAKLTTTEVEFDNSPGLAAGGEPFLVINCPIDQTIKLRQRNTEFVADAGDIGIGRGDEVVQGWVDGGSGVALKIPVSLIAPLLSRGADIAPTLFSRDAPVTKLVNAYLYSLLQNGPIADEALGKMVTRHVSDLIALGLGPSADGKEQITQRGVRAARLRAIQDYMRLHVDSPELSLQSVAREHGITPRYLQKLFENEGTTFSEYLLRQRLDFALGLLKSPNHMHLKISDIALASGFLDISYFNRAFRSRFGDTPTAIRTHR